MLSDREELQQQLAEANRKLKDLQLEIEQLAYAVAHDFREPLRGISTHAQLLFRQSPNNPEIAELTDYITESVNRLNSLVTDVSTYSKSGGPPRRTAMPLSLPVQWAQMQLQKQISETGAQVIMKDLPEVPIDETQFVQLFKHLIENAIKFRSSAPPVIEISAQEEDSGYLVSLSDNGVGIPPENNSNEKIFELFKRLHGKEVPGSGVGLSICRRIVRAHGGTIWAESDGQHGSTFKFTLPL